MRHGVSLFYFAPSVRLSSHFLHIVQTLNATSVPFAVATSSFPFLRSSVVLAVPDDAGGVYQAHMNRKYV